LENTQFSNKKIFVFGGLGFIGNRIALELSERFEVHVVDNCCSDNRVHPELLRRAEALKSKGVLVHSIDILDSDAMSELINGVSINTVFHLAGASSIQSTYSGEGFEQVLGITNELLHHLKNAEIDRIVYFSSSMIYGDFCHSSINESHAKKPVDRYGALKYASEVLVNSWAKETDTISIILRPTAVYGPNDIKHRIVAKFLDQASFDKDLTVAGDGESRLDFTYIDDVVAVSKAVLDHYDSGDFNVSFGQSRSLNELAELLKRVYPDANIKHNYINDHPTAKRGALNSEKAIRLLGYEPKFPLERGLLKMLRIEGNTELRDDTLMGGMSHPIIPLAKADVISTDFEILNTTLQTGWYTSGPQNTEFEKRFLEYLGEHERYALSVNSCASALELSLRAHNITGGVIVPAFTFSATVNAVIRAGAIPQFADIESQYLGLDSESVEKSITLETQAILVVHLAGTICDIDAIVRIAKRHKLVVIEDCAQALAAEYDGQQAGTFGDTSCFSFFPTKMITTGEGGMLVTKHAEVFHKARALANHGYNTSTEDREKQLKPWLREQVLPGFNFRMSSINASLGIAQLNRLDDIAKTRRKKALAITQGLKTIESIRVFEFDDRYSVYQALNILVPSDCNRDEFVLELRKKGVMASVHYPEVLPEISVFEQYNSGICPFLISREISERIVTLPLYGSITELQIQRLLYVVTSTAVQHKFML